jgi:hypothetical protein
MKAEIVTYKEDVYYVLDSIENIKNKSSFITDTGVVLIK